MSTKEMETLLGESLDAVDFTHSTRQNALARAHGDFPSTLEEWPLFGLERKADPWAPAISSTH